MAEIFSTGSSGNSQLDLLVEAYRRTQQPRLDTLNAKKSTLESRQRFFNNLNTRLNSVITQLDKFSLNDADEEFVTRKVNVSDDSAVSVSADSNAVTASNSIFVNRLASNDLLVSKQLTLADEFAPGQGTYEFTLTVNDEQKGFSIDVEEGDTNQQVLNKVVAAINSDEESGINASLVKDTSTTGRLSLTASETGSENNISFQDSALLSEFGFTSAALNPDAANRTLFTDSDAGFAKADKNNLDSNVKINGINVTRSSNTIEDALTGLSITLLKEQDEGEQAVGLKTEVDGSSVESLVQPLLDSFNSLYTFVKNNKEINRSDPAINSLQFRLRGIISEAVTPENEGDPRFLTEAGIGIKSDGTLFIEDKEELQELLEDDPSKVANLFVGENSFTGKLQNAIAGLIGDEGLVKSRTLSLTSQITLVDDRTEQIQSQIDSQTNAVRKEYERLLELYFNAQGQYNLFLQLPQSTDTSGLLL